MEGTLAKLPRARYRLVLTKRTYSSSQCFCNTVAYLTHGSNIFNDAVRLNNGIMFHCQTVKRRALEVNPIQSHFVNQYDGGQLGQRDLWYLADQSFDNDQSWGLVLMKLKLTCKSLIRSGSAWITTMYVWHESITSQCVSSVRGKRKRSTAQLKPLLGYLHWSKSRTARTLGQTHQFLWQRL